jgi:hypothetical protein
MVLRSELREACSSWYPHTQEICIRKSDKDLHDTETQYVLEWLDACGSRNSGQKDHDKEAILIHRDGPWVFI